MRSAFSILAVVLPTVAFAQATPAAGAAGSQFASFIPLLGIFAIFYVLLIRPQQKRLKEHQLMLTQLAKGDEVVTAGGIVGKITKVEAGDTFVVEIAKGVEVNVVKSTITTVLGKTPVKAAAPEKKKGGNKNDNSVVSRENIANDN
jgi:preprotein translocase subunit YajC